MQNLLRSFNCARTLVFTALLFLGFSLASNAEAANVVNCAASGKKCVIKLESGIIGDPVKILDDKARTIAVGRIIKRRGSYGVVSLTQVMKEIRKGYPVIVNIENRSSNLQWATSFGDSEE